MILVPDRLYSAEKTCIKCGQTKPLTAFNRQRGRRDGHRSDCRDCQRKAQCEWRRRNPDKWLAQQQRNRDRHRPAYRERARLWKERNHEKRLAHKAVAYALATGRLTRPNACAECDTVGPVEAHHDDYSQRLKVEWLCTPCHRRRDRAK